MTKSSSYNSLQREIVHRFKQGVHGMTMSLISIAMLFVYMISVAFILSIVYATVTKRNVLMAIPLFNMLLSSSYVLIFIFLVFIYICYLGVPKGYTRMKEGFERIGLVNHVNEVPLLHFKRTYTGKPPATHLYFENAGIPLDRWQQKKTDIEAILNTTIVDMKEWCDKRFVTLITIPGDVKFPEIIEWSNDKAANDSKINFGVDLAGQEYIIDINITPHILIGGSTGAGKTQGCKALIQQCIQKGYKVAVFDAKGGADWYAFSTQGIKIITEVSRLNAELHDIYDEMNCRIKKLVEAKCADISQFNTNHQPMERIIVLIDEVAALVDRTGITDKTVKQALDTTLYYLSQIARMGRSAGIHMVLATQRPSSDAVPGNIKSCIDVRIAYRCDEVLSRIIMDDTIASSVIPKDSRGVFVSNLSATPGTLYKGYYLNDKMRDSM